MACNLTTNLTNDCKNSAGGISTIYVAPITAKGTLQFSSGSVTNTGSFLSTGNQFYKYDLRKQSSEAKENITVNEANGTVFFAPEVDIVLTKTEVLKRNEIENLARQSVMVIYKDHTFSTGSYWLMGSDAGMEISGDQQTGKAYGDMNGYALKFTGQEMYPQLSVPASLIAALTTPAP
jgi:hypothetical protein